MDTNRRIYFVMGTSGSGKTTILRNIVDTFQSIKYLPSYTTRPMREGEKDGEKYHFMTTSEFEQGIQTGRWLEYAHSRQQAHRYGTDKQQVLDYRNQGYDVIKELDVLGLQQVLAGPFAHHARSIFLEVSEEIMQARLGHRGDMSAQQIANVIDIGRQETIYAHQYCTYIVDASHSIDQVSQTVYTQIIEDQNH